VPPGIAVALAGISAADDVNRWEPMTAATLGAAAVFVAVDDSPLCSQQTSATLLYVAVSPDTGPVLFEHSGCVVINFYLPLHLETNTLGCEIEPANAGE
jgi:hypothetical protein